MNDLKSFGELEKYIYGGEESFSYFNREVVKCSPFTHFPSKITKTNGTANFGYTWSIMVNNSTADYLTKTLLCVDLPEVELLPSNSRSENATLRWTENLAHNLIEECTLTFNDIVINKLDSFVLDFISEFCYDDSKYRVNRENIGNYLAKPSKKLAGTKLFLDLPLFFSKDFGSAIPLAALPNTEIMINFKFRNWEQLLIMEDSTAVDAVTWTPIVGKDITTTPVIKSAAVYGDFVTVSAEERARLKVSNKTMIVEQFQTSPRQMVSAGGPIKMDLLFKNSVKSLYFAVRNSTLKNSWSNYTQGFSKFHGGIFAEKAKYGYPEHFLEKASIKYGTNFRVEDMPIEYFHSISPMYFYKSTPKKNGLYAYGFAIDQESIDATGSVAMQRADNPSIELDISPEGKKAIDAGETFELVVVASSYNVMKLSEGLLTFVTV